MLPTSMSKMPTKGGYIDYRHEPVAGADSVTAQLFIARDGEPLSERFEGQVLTVEAKRIACMSSTHIAMLNVVGEAGRLAGVSGKSISPIPESRRTTTVSAASVTKGTSTMSCCFHSTRTSCSSTA